MVLFNLIFRLLSNVILVIRNGCLPKFGHLQSTVNKLLENSAPTRRREGWFVGRVGGGGWVGGSKGGGGVNVFKSLQNTHVNAHTPLRGCSTGDDKASKCNLMTSCVSMAHWVYITVRMCFTQRDWDTPIGWGESIDIAVSELLVAACERVAQMQNNIISPRFIFVHISLTPLT